MSKIPAHRRAFGDRVRELRSAGGYSQETLAHLIELDRTYISGLERGVRNPTLDVIVKVARGLGVHPTDLLLTIEDAGD
ncbi:helix-turn-helix domain-containing protein [Kocuria koreensis]|jgi:transcriptional regulator with XRE-family HTH domain|uniref:Helix-turn-helix domain-containing protein n=1 Tax=Rothia koreensis TaxID=592378 RepID=A0A7K1LFB1_9MICC|nr:helix-turn-helix transcriptional regulator [Rothia koreensis]MUN53874.1 helix-turn-helix domain-containing protein [Rothia koreensis]